VTAPGFSLRPVQLDALDAVSGVWRSGQRRALLVLPTGVGKTITALEAVRRTIARSPSARVLWLAHRSELCTQPLAAVRSIDHFDEVAAVAGVVRGDVAEYGARVVFATVQTISRRRRMAAYLEHGAPTLVIVDEAHHYVPGMQWGNNILRLVGASEDGAGGCHVLGLTATPERADSARLSLMWGELPAFAMSLQEAIDEGYLVPATFVDSALPVSDELQAAIDAANDEGGDDEDEELARALLDAGIVEHMADIVDGLDRRPALAFCMSVATVRGLVDALADRGHRVAGITGTTDDRVRAEALAAYADGRLDVLVNCSVLTEGTDLPRTSEIVLGRPCGSKSLYIQIVGRGARLYPGKESFRVHDVLGASKEHTLVSSVVLDIGRDDAGPRYVAGYDHQTPDYTAPRRSVWAAEPVHGAEPPLLRLTAPLPAMAGRPAGVMHREGPHVVEMAGWAPMGATGGGEGRAGVFDPSRKRRPWRPEWIDVCDGVRALGLGESGLAYTVETEGGVWPVWLPPRKRKARPLNSRPVSMEVAAALVAEVGRHAAQLVDRDAQWRRGAVTSGQWSYLERLGVSVQPMDRGHAERLITASKARARARSLGLVRGWSP
jgi:superfamily II DNA or RNA helicase